MAGTSSRLSDAALAALGAALGCELAARGRTLATAESCTGGWIAKALTDTAGSSAWFAGAVVCYSDRVKCRVLGVSEETLAAFGAVSEPTVEEMARGALELCEADVAVAVSGIAGPDGGVPGKPVGTVCFGWAWRTAGGIRTRVMTGHLGGDRETVRRETVAAALAGVSQLLEEKDAAGA
ncbi:MAG TPA: CinA family protein [Gammaproteobacteria bacterium]|nr:CinA family protein [Gammaproteobacteria bacterium]